MVTDHVSLAHWQDTVPRRSWIADAAYVAFLLLVFVGLEPFHPPLYAATAGAAQSAHGDMLRQIFYLAILGPIALVALQRKGFAILGAVPPLLLMLLGWCLLSSLWSAVPDITLRRAVLAVIVALSAILGVEMVGVERAFRIWRILLVMILLVNWVSIPLIPAARHLADSPDPGLIGDWRGLYSQKNTAGAMCVLTILLFAFAPRPRGSWTNMLVCAAAFGFLLMTRSKTSLGLLPIALGAGLIYRAAWKDGLSRALFACIGALLLLAVGVGIALYSDTIAQALEDPRQFTGRAEIWQASFAFLRDHPLLGAGFGTIANTGGLSPLHNYVRSSWVETIDDSHNGYLQLLVALGAIGFVLSMIALILAPARNFWRLRTRDADFRALLFALFVFVVLHNFMESDFVESDSGLWISFLFLLTALRQENKALTPSC